MTLLSRLVALESRRQPKGRRFLDVFWYTGAQIEQAAEEWEMTREQVIERLDAVETAVKEARAFFRPRRGYWSALVLRTALLAYVQPGFTFDDCEALIREMEQAGAPIVWDQ